jgi:hypothetical protein
MSTKELAPSKCTIIKTRKSFRIIYIIVENYLVIPKIAIQQMKYCGI